MSYEAPMTQRDANELAIDQGVDSGTLVLYT
jgi:hypothetical protein